jgi:hypothetical protein
MIYLERKPIEINLFYREANSSEEDYPGLEAFCQLGQYSILREMLIYSRSPSTAVRI